MVNPERSKLLTMQKPVGVRTNCLIEIAAPNRVVHEVRVGAEKTAASCRKAEDSEDLLRVTQRRTPVN